MRDNCPLFDVERYIAQSIDACDDKDNLDLGLKMIRNLAKSIKYVHSLENNSVILRFER